MGDLDTLLKILGFSSPGLILCVVILYVVFFHPDKVDRFVAGTLHLFSWSGDGIRKRAAQAGLQGEINDFGNELNKQVKGLMPYAVRVKFVKEVDRAELEPQKQTVIVRVRDRGYQDENLVRAMLAFCPVGVIPEAHRFLDPCLSEAIDFAVTRKLLAYLKHETALRYLNTVAFPEACEATDGLEQRCKELDRIDEQGFLTRIVLSELRDFGTVINARHPTREYADEADAFLKYILLIADRQPGQDLNVQGSLGEHIKAAVITVGRRARIQAQGLDPYLLYLLRLQEAGFKKVFIEAWGDEYVASALRRAGLKLRQVRQASSEQLADDQQPDGASDEHPLAMLDEVPGDSLSIKTAKALAAEAHEQGIARVGRTMPYAVRDKYLERTLRDYILIELSLN